jgi:hypothetical protein
LVLARRAIAKDADKYNSLVLLGTVPSENNHLVLARRAIAKDADKIHVLEHAKGLSVFWTNRLIARPIVTSKRTNFSLIRTNLQGPKSVLVLWIFERSIFQNLASWKLRRRTAKQSFASRRVRYYIDAVYTHERAQPPERSLAVVHTLASSGSRNHNRNVTYTRNLQCSSMERQGSSEWRDLDAAANRRMSHWLVRPGSSSSSVSQKSSFFTRYYLYD